MYFQGVYPNNSARLPIRYQRPLGLRRPSLLAQAVHGALRNRSTQSIYARLVCVDQRCSPRRYTAPCPSASMSSSSPSPDHHRSMSCSMPELCVCQCQCQIYVSYMHARSMSCMHARPRVYKTLKPSFGISGPSLLAWVKWFEKGPRTAERTAREV